MDNNTNRKLLLDRCTKESCRACDTGYIIKDHIKALMQCLTIDIPDYYMRLLTSKCLNLAILISFFMAGRKKAIEMGNYCDTHETTKRHQSGTFSKFNKDGKYNTNGNEYLINKLQSELLNKNIKHRYLYYILMTDAYLPVDNSTEQKFFCGHVMVVEKIPGHNGNLPFYYFYQAYINEYDFNGHVKRHKNTLKKSYEEMHIMLEQIKYILLNKTWDATSIKYWKDITFVDTTQLKDGKPADKIYLCYTRTKLTECVGYLHNYVKSHLKKISKLKIQDMNKIYGDESLFDKDQEPLTTYQIKTNFEQLENKLISHKTLLV